MKTIMNLFVLPAVIILLIIGSCKKKDVEGNSNLPKVTTNAVTDITGISVIGSGTITGGSGVIISGICWSKTNHTPTVEDSKATSTTNGSRITAQLTGLEENTQYYVRAYATNSNGTGYGDVKTFTTVNAAPVAKDVKITGNKVVGGTITAIYTYYDVESNPESSTTFSWYRANDTIGGAISTIIGATTSTYVITSNDTGRYLRVGVTPKSNVGTATGTESTSYWIAIGNGETVTFSYNGQTVVYGVITSPTTGRKWLDRNLGALNIPSSPNDWNNKGDLFQWGRAPDGHQLISRAESTQSTLAVNELTNILSSTPSPGHNKFIKNEQLPGDWLISSSDQLWQSVNGTNNPCPLGWRVPTFNEFLSENILNMNDGYNKLKLTFGGMRHVFDGRIEFTVTDGYYWTSTLSSDGSVRVMDILISDVVLNATFFRGHGASVRCIRD